VKSGEWVAVHGCGGVGLSAIMIANALGAKVVAVDIDQQKLEFAREVGARAIVDGFAVADVPSAIHDITKGGAHLSIDALGHPTTCVNSIAGLRRRGRHVQVGLLWEGATLPMSRIISHELEVVGSHGIQASRYGALLEMIQSGRLDPKRLIGRRITLEEAPAALMNMADFQGVGITVMCNP
jgi:alcohol dehydrogenase